MQLLSLRLLVVAVVAVVGVVDVVVLVAVVDVEAVVDVVVLLAALTVVSWVDVLVVEDSEEIVLCELVGAVFCVVGVVDINGNDVVVKVELVLIIVVLSLI